MPVYFFQSQPGAEVTVEPEGFQLLNIEAAFDYATLCARELLSQAIRFDLSVPDRIFVVNAEGIELLTISLADVLPKSMKN